MSDKDRDRQEFEKRYSDVYGLAPITPPYETIYLQNREHCGAWFNTGVQYAREAEQPAGGDELQRLNDAHKEYADARIDAHNAFYLLSNKYGYRFRLDKALDAYELTRQKSGSEAERKPGEDVERVAQAIKTVLNKEFSKTNVTSRQAENCAKAAIAALEGK